MAEWTIHPHAEPALSRLTPVAGRTARTVYRSGQPGISRPSPLGSGLLHCSPPLTCHGAHCRSYTPQVAEIAALLYPQPLPSPAGVHVVAHIHSQLAEIAALLPPQIKHGIAEGEHLGVGGAVRN